MTGRASRRARNLAFGVAISAATVAAYWNSRHAPLVFDDHPYIADNIFIRNVWAPGEIIAHSTRPVVMVTFAVNFALGQVNPLGYHVVNVMIHVLSALLLFAVVRRSMESPQLQWKWAPAAPWLAGIVALLWAVHPLQTESVTYIWQRCESLMGLFYLLTLYCVIRSSSSLPRAIWWWAAAVVSCALGMASKEAMATAPLVVLLYDRAFLVDSWRGVWRRRWPLYVGLAATWGVLIALIHHGLTDPGVVDPTAKIGVEGIGPWQYLLTQSGVIMYYLRLAFWPDRLCLDYEFSWPVAKSITDVWPWLIAVGCLLLLTAWAWRRQPALGFIGVWFFLILAPTSSFVPIADVAFEHRMYLPLVAVILLVVLAVVVLLERLPDGWRWPRWLAAASALALALALIAVTIERNEVYGSELGIWQDTVAKQPRNARAHLNTGVALVRRHRYDEARRHYLAALQLNPDQQDVLNNLGNVLQRQGQFGLAIECYQRILRLNPGSASAHCNLGLAYQALGRFQDAVDEFQIARSIAPNRSEPHNSLAWIRATCPNPTIRNEALAIGDAQRAVELSPHDPEFLHTLAAAYSEAGRFSEATDAAQQALTLAVAADNEALATALRAELALYETHVPYGKLPTPQSSPKP